MCKVYTGYCGISEIELKLADYLSVQTHKPCFIFHLFASLDFFALPNWGLPGRSMFARLYLEMPTLSIQLRDFFFQKNAYVCATFTWVRGQVG